MGPRGTTGPRGPKGEKGSRGPTGPVGSSIISFFPFVNSSGFKSTTYSDGDPAQVGIVSFGETFTANVSGGLSGTVMIPGFNQYGIIIPVNCILDTICLSVGNPAFTPASAQVVHTFAMLATTEGDSQLFTLHPATKAETTFIEGVFYPAQIHTTRVAGLAFALTAETRCMLVCGHYTMGDVGSTSYTFTYSASLLFK